MASLCTTLKPLSPFSSLAKEHSFSNKKVLFSLSTHSSFLTKRRELVAHKKRTFVTNVHDNVLDQVESSWRLPLSDVVVVRDKERSFWKRSWSTWDASKFVIFVGIHLLSLLAPFYFSWAAVWSSFVLVYIGVILLTLSYHRNLSHLSFELPKWLEYLFAYGGLLTFQGDPMEWVSNHRYHHKYSETERDPHSPTKGFWFSHCNWAFDNKAIFEKCGGEENVNDLKKQPFYRFLQRTVALHVIAYTCLVYYYGGMPLLVWGIGVSNVVRLHLSFLGTSVCHIWGKRAWNTPDLSKNNWWVAILTLGDGWHNNHHAFEFSARHGLEWWQLDVTWLTIRFLEIIGLATNIKLPTESQKKLMALSNA